MATETIIARRYARALLELVSKGNNLLEARDRLADIAQAAVGDPAARPMWLAPQVTMEQKSEVLEKILSAVHASKVVHDFCRHLLARGRFALVGLISREFDAFCRDRLAQMTAVVRSPRPIEGDVLERLKRQLSQVAGKTVACRVDVDPQMIGGIQVLLENTVIDGSIRGKLAAARAALTEAAAVPGAR